MPHANLLNLTHTTRVFMVSASEDVAWGFDKGTAFAKSFAKTCEEWHVLAGRKNCPVGKQQERFRFRRNQFKETPGQIDFSARVLRIRQVHHVVVLRRDGRMPNPILIQWNSVFTTPGLPFCWREKTHNQIFKH